MGARGGGQAVERLAREPERESHRVGKRIAGHGLKQACAHAGAGDGIAGRPVEVEVAAMDHGQHALFAMHAVRAPAPCGRIGGDAVVQRGAVQIGRVAVIGVLDEDGAIVPGKEIDEAVAVQLVDAGVHDDGALDAMGRIAAQGVADEFLPAAMERRQVARTPRIEHRLCANGAAIG